MMNLFKSFYPLAYKIVLKIHEKNSENLLQDTYNR